jgi:hypothetical protein
VGTKNNVTYPPVVNIKTDNTAVYVHGEFKSVNSVPRVRLAAISKVGSISEVDTVFPWFADLTGPYPVSRNSPLLVLSATNSVIVGGSFTAANGIRRQGLARFVSNGSYLTPPLYKYVTWQVNGCVLSQDSSMAGALNENWATYRVPAGVSRTMSINTLDLSLSTVRAFDGIKQGDPIKVMIRRVSPLAGETESFYGVLLDFETLDEIENLNQHAKIEIINQPKSVKAFVNQVVTLSTAIAENTLPTSYQWLKGVEEIQGATSNKLTLTSVKLEDASDKYSVRIYNALDDVTSNEVELSVVNIELISASPLTNIIRENTNLTLSALTQSTSAGFVGFPLSTSPVFAWYFNDTLKISGVNLSAINLTNVQPWIDSGTYHLEIYNDYGHYDVDYTVEVNNISILNQPTSATVVSGLSVEFNVTAASNTTPLLYRWSYNGAQMSDSDIIVGSTTNKLRILSAVPERHEGTYSVLVSSISSTLESTEVFLDVLNPE